MFFPLRHEPLEPERAAVQRLQHRRPTPAGERHRLAQGRLTRRVLGAGYCVAVQLRLRRPVRRPTPIEQLAVLSKYRMVFSIDWHQWIVTWTAIHSKETDDII